MTIADQTLAALKAAMPALTVYDAHVDRNGDGTPLLPHYVVQYPDLGELSTAALSGTVDRCQITIRLTYVSTTRGNVEAFAKAARAVIIDKTFTDGVWTGTFDPDLHHNTTPVTWDESIADRLVMYASDEFGALAHK